MDEEKLKAIKKIKECIPHLEDEGISDYMYLFNIRAMEQLLESLKKDRKPMEDHK